MITIHSYTKEEVFDKLAELHVLSHDGISPTLLQCLEVLEEEGLVFRIDKQFPSLQHKLMNPSYTYVFNDVKSLEFAKKWLEED